MENWTEIKQIFETEYLAEALRGRITFHLAQDRRRSGEYVFLHLDGEDVKKDKFYEFYEKSHLFPADSPYRWEILSDLRDSGSLNPGLCPAWEFSEGWADFLRRSAADNLRSGTLIPSLLAILDRRVTAQELLSVNERLLRWSPILQYVYWLRTEAEGIALPHKLLR